MGKKGGVAFRCVVEESVPELPAQLDDVGLLLKKSTVAPVSGTHTACQLERADTVFLSKWHYIPVQIVLKCHYYMGVDGFSG